MESRKQFEIYFDHCQCQLIQSELQTEDEQERSAGKNSLSWIKINELCIGRCKCINCGKDTRKPVEDRSNSTTETGYTGKTVNGFFSPSIHNYKQGALFRKNCLDVYEMKCNVIEAALETAESIASLGAIVSIK